MIVEYVRYHLADHERDGFEAAYGQAADLLRQAEQCVDYELARSVDEPTCYILRITWTSARDHVEAFRGGELFAPFLVAVRPFAAQIEEMRHYERTSVHGSGAALPSLYDWAGGADAFERLTQAFYAAVASDDLVGPLFTAMDPSHPHYVALWLAEVFGGPHRYTTERGGYPHMLAHHVGKEISEAQRRRWVALLCDAADEVRLPDDPEFRAAFVGYLEWGTRLAVHNSQPGARPPGRASVPEWGWGVAPPYRG